MVVAYLRPDSDVSITDWTDQAGGTATISSTINETSPSDAGYIRSPIPPNGSVARFRLSNPAAGKWLGDPAVVSYRFKKTRYDSMALKATLKQGTTEIASWLHSNADTATKLLLHMDGAPGSTTFTDASLSAHGNATVGGNAQVWDIGEGDVAAYFDSDGDYISFPAHADYELGVGNFTIDCWFNCHLPSGPTIMLAAQNGEPAEPSNYSFWIERSNDVMDAGVSDGITWFAVGSTTPCANGGWHHVALVRTGNILKLFIDGIQEAADVPFSGAVQSSSGSLSLGRAGDTPNYYWGGYIDEFRFIKGVARWTSNFTPQPRTSPYTVAASSQPLTESFQTVSQTLTAPQLAAITDFDDLYIEFQASW